MDIRITDKYELRRVDAMNWQLYKLKKLEGGKRKGEVDWVPLQCFPRDVPQAVRWIAENAPRADWAYCKVDLDDFLAEMEKLEQSMGRHARAFARSIEKGGE